MRGRTGGDALQLKLAERRGGAYEPVARSADGEGGTSPEFVAIAQGGEGDRGPAEGDVDRGLARAVRTAGTVRYGDGGGTGRFARSLHGVAIPLRFGGGVLAVLALETGRRGDLRARDVERLEAALDDSVGALLAARLDARDRRRRERDEARDQILALSAELARERDRVQRLRGYALSFGARLWRMLTIQRLDYDLGTDED